MSKIAASAKKNKIIYLDYAATTPIDQSVLKKMLPYFGGEYSNSSSMHESGRRARQAISHARREIADIIGSSPEEIIFTGSGTEADNLALIGIARSYRHIGNHIIISAIEHKAVTESARLLEKEGFIISVLPVDHNGVINIDECIKQVTKNTILISVMYANNEIGTIEPIRELSTALLGWRASNGNTALPFLHTDACQAAGFLSLNVNELGVDLMTVNGSKIYGPKGVGFLFKKKGISIQPLIVGGEQENNLRAGTESIPLIVGLAEALIISNNQREIKGVRLAKLREYFFETLLQKIPNALVNGHRVRRLPNNVHISIPNIEGESILLMLDKQGVEASTGSACSSFDLKPSHVLLAIGQTPECAHGSIRFSLGRSTTKSDIDHAVSILVPIVSHLSRISAMTVLVKSRTSALGIFGKCAK